MTRRPLPLLIAVLTLAGCAAAPPVPRDNFYRIDVAAPAREARPLLPGVVLVHPLRAAGLLQERPVLFTSAGQLHSMRQHDYHFWNEPPPQMLQAALISFLRAGGIAETVVTPDLRLPARFEIMGKVKRLERVLAEPSGVHAELELAVIDTTAIQLIVSRTYTAEIESNGESVAAAVVALDQALAEIFADFVADLRNAGNRAIEAQRGQ